MMRRRPSSGLLRIVLFLFLGCAVDDFEGCEPEQGPGDICITPGPERLEVRCGGGYLCDVPSRRCASFRANTPCDLEPCGDDTLECTNGRCAVVGGQGYACGGDSDCLPEFSCVGGDCIRRTDCVQDGNCVPGKICVGGECVEDDTPLCETDADCSGRGVCQSDGSCLVPPCGTDADCGGVFVCVAETCEFPDRLTCETNAECTGGRVCVGDECVECGSDEQCDGAQTCGRRSLCVEPGLQNARCTADDECVGYCEEDSFCTNGEAPARCDGTTTCPTGTVCNGGVDPVGDDPTEGRCAAPEDGDCSWDPWSGRSPVGCTAAERCVPDGSVVSESDAALWVMCAADPAPCVGARGRCQPMGSLGSGPCLADDFCATGTCVSLPTPEAVAVAPGFDCSGGPCVWLGGWPGGCLEGGQPALGDPCSGDFECMERTFCDGETCRGENTARLGERCRGSGGRRPETRCAFGLVCMTDILCHAVRGGALGSPCSERDDCAEDLGCDGSACAALPGPGSGCTAESPCAEPGFCLSETNVCFDGPRGDVGDGCETLACGAGLYCAADMACARAALPGDVCGSDLPCIGGWRCETGRCVAVN